MSCVIKRRNLKKKNENNANKNDETSIEMKPKDQEQIKTEDQEQIKPKDEEQPIEHVYNQFSIIPQSDEWFMVGKSNISPSIYSQMSHIDASELKFEKVIGNGSFGQVWKGNWRKLIVAIKQVKQNTIDEKGKFLKFISRLCSFNFSIITFKTQFTIKTNPKRIIKT